MVSSPTTIELLRLHRHPPNNWPASYQHRGRLLPDRLCAEPSGCNRRPRRCADHPTHRSQDQGRNMGGGIGRASACRPHLPLPTAKSAEAAGATGRAPFCPTDQTARKDPASPSSDACPFGDRRVITFHLTPARGAEVGPGAGSPGERRRAPSSGRSCPNAGT